MKRHKKAWLLALILFCSLAFSKMALAQTTVKDIQKRGELIVGVKQDVPNFGYKDPKTGRYTGLEVDIAKLSYMSRSPTFLSLRKHVVHFWTMSR